VLKILRTLILCGEHEYDMDPCVLHHITAYAVTNFCLRCGLFSGVCTYKVIYISHVLCNREGRCVWVIAGSRILKKWD